MEIGYWIDMALFSRRRIHTCQKILAIILIILLFLTFFNGELGKLSMERLKENADYSVEDLPVLSDEPEKSHFSTDFVIISNELLRVKWQKQSPRKSELYVVQSVNGSFQTGNNTELKLDDKHPGLILYRPRSEQQRYNPFLALSARQTEIRRDKLAKYLALMEEKFTPIPTANEYINYTLIEGLSKGALMSSQKGPIIVLFTTFKHKQDNITLKMNTNLLKQWARLKPWVELILFLDPFDIYEFEISGLNYLAASIGWKIVKISRTIHKFPLIKDMYKTAVKFSDASIPFIAYANSDIIFDVDLIETLVFLWKVSSKPLQEKGCLLIGKRSPISLATFEKEFVSKNLNKTALYKFRNSLVKDADYSFDYFITTRNGFKWDKTPNFVVGKPGYDAWIVTMALEWDLITIDLTKSVTAYHLIYGTNLFPEKGWMADDVCMNRVLVDPFDYSRAHTHCAKYFTVDVYTKNITLEGNSTFIKQTNKNIIDTLQLYKREVRQDVCSKHQIQQVRENSKKHYPGCKETAIIKRSKFSYYNHVLELIKKANERLVRLQEQLPVSNKNLVRVIR